MCCSSGPPFTHVSVGSSANPIWVQCNELAIFGNFVAITTDHWYCQSSLNRLHRLLIVISSHPAKATQIFVRERRFGKVLRIKQAIGLTTTAGLLFTGCATSAGGGAEGDDFPNEDIRLVVPWEAVGSR